jgi:hypothetical protein
VSHPDYLEELARLRDVKDDVEGLILKAVKGARRRGVSWYLIGPALGVTRQAAAEKYNRLMKAKS